MKSVRYGVITVGMALMASAAPAGAATYTVSGTADGAGTCVGLSCSTLRAAVDAANAAAGADEISLGAGTFTLAGAANDNANASGDLDITGTLTITGAGAAFTSLHGGGVDRVLHVLTASGASLTLDRLTVTGGHSPNSAAGVLAGGPALTLVDVAVNGLTGERAIHVDDGGVVIDQDLTLRRTAVSGLTMDEDVVELSPRGTGTLTLDGAQLTGNTVADGAVVRLTSSMQSSSAPPTKLVATDSTVAGNTLQGEYAAIEAAPGGAVTYAAEMHLVGTTVSGNRATPTADQPLVKFAPSTSAPGIAGVVRITDSSFLSNELEHPQPRGVLEIGICAPSGEIALDGHVSGSRFANNANGAEGLGGAVHVRLVCGGPNGGGTQSVVVSDSVFDANRAGEAGGALFMEAIRPATLLVERSTFSSNQAGSATVGTAAGGAIALRDKAQATIVNSTLHANTVAGAATNRGGAIHSDATSLAVRHATVTANQAAQGGGAIFAPSGAVTLAGSIVAGNGPASCAVSGSATVVSSGSNLFDDSACAFAAPGDRQVADPGLDPLAANGGPTPTRALRAGSPALDGALPATCPATDQRGIARPQGAGCDHGAFELGVAAAPGNDPPPTVVPDPRPPAVAPPPGLEQFLASLPATRRCLSRRSFRIRLRVPRGVRVREARVHVNGKRVAVRRGSRFTAPVDLRRLPRGKFKVKVTIVLADGRKVVGTRTYRTCARKAKGGRPRV